MNITFAGDWHGVLADAQQIIEHPDTSQIIVHLGDLGLFDLSYPQDLTNLLTLHDRYLFFIDGNHEDFDLLHSFTINPDPNPISQGPTRQITPRIFHLPRASTHTFGTDTTFLAFGGAYSIDRKYRTLGLSYWEEEVPSPETFRLAQQISLPPYSVFLSHDTPFLPPHLENIYQAEYPKASFFYGEGHVNNTDNFRLDLQHLFSSLSHTPSAIIHGHHHRSLFHYRGVNGTEVHVLGLADGSYPLKESTVTLYFDKENND